MTLHLATHMKQQTVLLLSVLALLAALLTGCAAPGEKRHTPAEIAAYRPADFASPVASAAGEQTEFNQAMEKIRSARALPADAEGGEILPEALHAVAFLNTEREAGRSILMNALRDLDKKPAGYQRDVLSAAHSLYPAESLAPVSDLLAQLGSPREFAIAAYTVLRSDGSGARREALAATLRARFPDWQKEPRLIALDHVLSTDAAAERKARPPLADLLAAPLRRGYPAVFSLQRADRRHFGLAVVRGADGRFVRNADGSLFHISQLAMAITNLPGTITNGNTPQGLFTVVGAGTATNRWIGPTPYLESKVPVEATVAEFEHAAVPGEWSEDRYEAFLPASWRAYFPIKEAWLAGLAGRNEMLMHGTTINPDYYRGTEHYPGTPSAGCLVAMEYWAKADGTLLQSDQLSLGKAFTRDGIDQGYLVVVELDDSPQAVTLAEVQEDILRAESALAALRAAN